MHQRLASARFTYERRDGPGSHLAFFPRVMNLAVLLWFGWALLSHATVLVDFQVAQPPVVPTGVEKCTVEIFRWVLNFHLDLYCNL